MPTFLRPDVYAQEVLSPSFVASTPPGPIATFIGPHPKGPIVPTIVEGWSQFVSLFGGFNLIGANGQPLVPSFLALSVYNYFQSGGRTAQIVRVVASGAQQATPQPGLPASVTLSDQAATPQATVQVSAANPGAWGNGIYVDTIYRAPTTGSSGTFDLIVHVGGSGSAFIAEKWMGVSMDPTNPQYAPNIINNEFNGSNLIHVADLASGTTPPNNEPAAVSGVHLTGGVDGAAPTSLDTQTAFEQLDLYPGPMMLNLPGNANPTDIGNLISYALARQDQDSFVVIDPPQGSTPDAVTSFAEDLVATSYAALYYPWINISDPVGSTSGALRTCPPGGFALGVIANTDTTRGTWKAPAGLQAQLVTGLSPERMFTPGDRDKLATARVNPILRIPQSGLCVFDALTLSNAQQTQFIPVRRSLIEIRLNLINKSRFALFEPNDSTTWTNITNQLTQYLLSFWQSGGLAGSTAADAFYVLCDATNNPPAKVQQGIVSIEVGVAPQYPARFIIINIGLWQGAQNTQSTVNQ
jgi:uncharacterized protein